MNDPYILVLEEEFLIGVELERLLSENGFARVQLVHSIEDAEATEGSWEHCIGAIIETMLAGVSTSTIATRLRDAKIPLIFGTGRSEHKEGVSDFPDIAVLMKPYVDADVTRALKTYFAVSGRAS